MSERVKNSISLINSASNPTFSGTIKVEGKKVYISGYRIDKLGLDPKEASCNFAAKPEGKGEASQLSRSWLKKHEGKQLTLTFHYVDGTGPMIGGIGTIFKGMVYKKGEGNEEHNAQVKDLNKYSTVIFRSPFK
ncbi:MAG TPA: hypothetical protein VF185_00360 [Patescibacteria group bacterium]